MDCLLHATGAAQNPSESAALLENGLTCLVAGACNQRYLQLWSGAALPGCIARVLHGEKMAGPCAEFGISRKTGYKIYDRYKDCGLQGSRRPYPLTVTDFASPLISVGVVAVGLPRVR